ncbi:MAG: S49 family peptidase [Pirellulales bacterium]
MSGIDQLLANLLSVSSRLGGGLWLMDDRAMLQYISRPRIDFDGPKAIAPSSLITPRASTAVIAVHGVLMKDPWYDDETSTPAIEEATRIAANDPQFDSILYDVDSPGGSSAGIAGLSDAVQEAASKKVVWAQSTGMIASGAYWLSANAQKVFADRMDWIGSIGVRMDVLDVSRWFANMGIERVAIDTGPLKSTGLFGTEVTEEQRAYLKTLVDDTHQHFSAVVKQGRKMSDAQFSAVATGGVFPASTALRLNLIDGIQTFDKTLAAMPRRQPATQQRSKAMSDTTTQESAAPKAATSKELKARFPKSSAEWRESQVDAGATLESAAIAYAEFVQEQLDKANAEKAEADKKAAEAEAARQKAGQSTGGRGNSLRPVASAEVEPSDVDFRQLARAYMEKNKCRWAEACLEIKRKYPEAQTFFGLPPEKN